MVNLINNLKYIRIKNFHTSKYLQFAQKTVDILN